MAKKNDWMIYGVIIIVALVAGAFFYCGDGRCAALGQGIDDSPIGQMINGMLGKMTHGEEAEQATMYGGLYQ